MRNWKKAHRIVALVAILPLTMTALSGVVLQLRNQFEFIQPSSVNGERIDDRSILTMEEVQEKYIDEKIEQVIYRPSKKTMTIRLSGGDEVQIHHQTGQELKRAPRRTGFLIELHQGSWLGKFGQYGIYFIGSLGLCFLILSGIIIYPIRRKSL